MWATILRSHDQQNTTLHMVRVSDVVKEGTFTRADLQKLSTDLKGTGRYVNRQAASMWMAPDLIKGDEGYRPLLQEGRFNCISLELWAWGNGCGLVKCDERYSILL